MCMAFRPMTDSGSARTYVATATAMSGTEVCSVILDARSNCIELYTKVACAADHCVLQDDGSEVLLELILPDKRIIHPNSTMLVDYME